MPQDYPSMDHIHYTVRGRERARRTCAEKERARVLDVDMPALKVHTSPPPQEYEHVYEPGEDTILLCDAITASKDLLLSAGPPVLVGEIG
jgi:hypothetical protein